MIEEGRRGRGTLRKGQSGELKKVAGRGRRQVGPSDTV